MNGRTSVSIHLTRSIGERTIDMTLHGSIDGEGTFHYFDVGRGGKEHTIPNAWGLVIKPAPPPLTPMPPETKTGFEHFK